MVTPSTWICQSEFGISNTNHTSPNRGVITIRTDDLPSAPVVESNEHGVLTSGLAQRRGKSLINPPLPGVRINRGPERFATLLVLGKTMPVVAFPHLRGTRRPMQRNIILASTPVPYG